MVNDETFPSLHTKQGKAINYSIDEAFSIQIVISSHLASLQISRETRKLDEESKQNADWSDSK